jgi:tripartite-type tricarboxylate transporter receptor subunit TctC
VDQPWLRVAGIAREPFAIEVHPSVPVKTVPEFITYAKANPGKINMASAGIGSASHITGELFNMMTGVNLVNVPYRGAGPARDRGAHHRCPSAQVC